MVLCTTLTPLGSGMKNPYKPHSVLAFSGGEFNFTAMLPKGVFQVCLVGTGATGSNWWFNSYGCGSTGGSAAVVEVVFYNPRRQSVELYAGGAITTKGMNGTAAYMKLNGIIMVTANGGSKGEVDKGGKGGTYEINSDLQVLSILKAENGNVGNVNISGLCGTVMSASPYENWGRSTEGSATSGGLRLEYIRRLP